MNQHEHHTPGGVIFVEDDGQDAPPAPAYVRPLGRAVGGLAGAAVLWVLFSPLLAGLTPADPTTSTTVPPTSAPAAAADTRPVFRIPPAIAAPGDARPPVDCAAGFAPELVLPQRCGLSNYVRDRDVTAAWLAEPADDDPPVLLLRTGQLTQVFVAPSDYGPAAIFIEPISGRWWVGSYETEALAPGRTFAVLSTIYEHAWTALAAPVGRLPEEGRPLAVERTFSVLYDFAVALRLPPSLANLSGYSDSPHALPEGD